MIDSVPVRVGRYTIVRPLYGAQGFLAFTVEADQTRTPVLLRLIARPGDRAEAMSLVEIRHRSLLPIVDVESSKTHSALISEFPNGISLREMTDELAARGECLELSTALEIAGAVVDALEYLHSLHLGHGALDAQKVHLTKNGKVLVAEFGCVRLQRKLPDLQHDIFATGLLLWELLTGRDYWAGMSEEEVQKASHQFVPRNPKELRPDLPTELAELTVNCLGVEGFKGYSSIEDVRQDLETIRSELPAPPAKTKLSKVLKQRFERQLKLAEERIAGIHSLEEGSIDVPLPPPPTQAPAPQAERPKELWDHNQASNEEAPQVTRPILLPSINAGPTSVLSGTLVFLLLLVGGIFLIALSGNPGARKAFAQGHRWQTFRYLQQEMYYSVFPLPKNTRPGTQGVVRIETNPPGARIWINGAYLQRVTPTQVYVGPKALTLISVGKGDKDDVYLYLRPDARLIRIDL